MSQCAWMLVQILNFLLILARKIKINNEQPTPEFEPPPSKIDLFLESRGDLHQPTCMGPDSAAKQTNFLTLYQFLNKCVITKRTSKMGPISQKACPQCGPCSEVL